MDNHVCPRAIEYACERGHEHRFYTSVDSTVTTIEAAFIDDEDYKLTVYPGRVVLGIDEGTITVSEYDTAQNNVCPRVDISSSLSYLTSWFYGTSIYVRKHRGMTYSYLASPVNDLRWFMHVVLQNHRKVSTVDSLQPDPHHLNLLST